jgi:ribosome-associated toxin RatA of RatAB toxin-antitoxin module
MILVGHASCTTGRQVSGASYQGRNRPDVPTATGARRMPRSTRCFAVALAALALAASAAPQAFADTPTDAARLRATRAAERYNLPTPGTSINTGGAQILVNAPLALVRQIVTDYGHYQDFMTKFRRSRVVQKNKDFTDVYLQVPIMHGAATFWGVTRFGKPKRLANGTEIIEGTLQQGNVDEFKAVWKLVPVDANHTILKVELLILPRLPLPASIVTPELEYASDQAVTASRNRAEASATRVASGTPTTP